MHNQLGSKDSRAATSVLGGPVEGIILIDLEFRSVAVDNGGRRILGELRDPNAAECPLPGLPPQIEKPLRELPPSELNAAMLRISAEDSHYTCEVFFMQPQNGVLTEPLLALYLKKERSVGEAVVRAARFYRLTERETETLSGIAGGLTSREIAAKMNISPNTVNAFLRLIMVKMGVTTRAGVVGKLVNGKAVEDGSPARRRGAAAFPSGLIQEHSAGAAREARARSAYE